MSVFYLDTELTDFTIEYIAKICAESTYSIEEIEKIMFTEVWPAFIGNLWSVAGEWAGWEPEFVQQRVLARFRPRLYFSWRRNPLKRFYCGRWAEVEVLIRAIRERQRGAGA